MAATWLDKLIQQWVSKSATAWLKRAAVTETQPEEIQQTEQETTQPPVSGIVTKRQEEYEEPGFLQQVSDTFTGIKNWFTSTLTDNKTIKAGFMPFGTDPSVVEWLAREVAMFELTPVTNMSPEELDEYKAYGRSLLKRMEEIQITPVEKHFRSYKVKEGEQPRPLTKEDLLDFLDVNKIDVYAEMVEEMEKSSTQQEQKPTSRVEELMLNTRTAAFNNITPENKVIDGKERAKYDPKVFDGIYQNGTIQSALRQLATFIDNYETADPAAQKQFERMYDTAVHQLDVLTDFISFSYDNIQHTQGDAAQMIQSFIDQRGYHPLQMNDLYREAMWQTDVIQGFKNVNNSIELMKAGAEIARISQWDENIAKKGRGILVNSLKWGLWFVSRPFLTIAGWSEQLANMLDEKRSWVASDIGYKQLNNVKKNILGESANLDTIMDVIYDAAPTLAADAIAMAWLSKVFKAPEILDATSKASLQMWKFGAMGSEVLTNQYKIKNLARAIYNSIGLNLSSGVVITNTMGYDYTKEDFIFDMFFGVFDIWLDASRVLSKSSINKATKEYEDLFRQQTIKDRANIPDTEWNMLTMSQKSELWKEFKQFMWNIFKEGDPITQRTIQQAIENHKEGFGAVQDAIQKSIDFSNQFLVTQAKQMKWWKDLVETIKHVDELGNVTITHQFKKSVTANDLSELNATINKKLAWKGVLGELRETIKWSASESKKRARQTIKDNQISRRDQKAKTYFEAMLNRDVWANLNMQNAWRLLSPGDAPIFNRWTRTKYPDPNDATKSALDLTTPAKLKRAITEFGNDILRYRAEYEHLYPHRLLTHKNQYTKSYARRFSKQTKRGESLGIKDITDLSYDEAIKEFPNIKQNGRWYFDWIMNSKRLSWEEKNFLLQTIEPTPGRKLNEYNVPGERRVRVFNDPIERDYFLGNKGTINIVDKTLEYTKTKRPYKKWKEVMYQYVAKDTWAWAFDFFIDSEWRFVKWKNFPKDSTFTIDADPRTRTTPNYRISKVNLNLTSQQKQMVKKQLTFTDMIRKAAPYEEMIDAYPTMLNVPRKFYDEVKRSNKGKGTKVLSVQEKQDLIYKASMSHNFHEAPDSYWFQLRQVWGTPVFTSTLEAEMMMPNSGYITLANKEWHGTMYFYKQWDLYVLTKWIDSSVPIGAIRPSYDKTRIDVFINWKSFDWYAAIHKWTADVDKVANRFYKWLYEATDVKTLTMEQAISLVDNKKPDTKDFIYYQGQTPQMVVADKASDIMANPFFKYTGIDSKNPIEIIEQSRKFEVDMEAALDFKTKYATVDGLTDDMIWESLQRYNKIQKGSTSWSLRWVWFVDTVSGVSVLGSREATMGVILKWEYGIALNWVDETLLKRFQKRRDNILKWAWEDPSKMTDAQKRDSYKFIQDLYKENNKIFDADEYYWELTKWRFDRLSTTVLDKLDELYIRYAAIKEDIAPIIKECNDLIREYNKAPIKDRAMRQDINRLKTDILSEQQKIIDLETEWSDYKLWYEYEQYAYIAPQMWEPQLLELNLNDYDRILNDTRKQKAKQLEVETKPVTTIEEAETVVKAEEPVVELTPKEELNNLIDEVPTVDNVERKVDPTPEPEPVWTKLESNRETELRKPDWQAKDLWFIQDPNWLKELERMKKPVKVAPESEPVEKVIESQYKKDSTDTTIGPLDKALSVLYADISYYKREHWATIASSSAARQYIVRALYMDWEIPKKLYDWYLISIGKTPGSKFNRSTLRWPEMIRLSDEMNTGIKYVPLEVAERNNQLRSEWFMAISSYNDPIELSAARREFDSGRFQWNDFKYTKRIKEYENINTKFDKHMIYEEWNINKMSWNQFNDYVKSSGNKDLFTAKEMENMFPMNSNIKGPRRHAPMVGTNIHIQNGVVWTPKALQDLLKIPDNHVIFDDYVNRVRLDMANTKWNVGNESYGNLLNVENQIYKKHGDFKIYAVAEYDPTLAKQMATENNVMIWWGSPGVQQQYQEALLTSHTLLDPGDYRYRPNDKRHFDQYKRGTEISDNKYFVRTDPEIKWGKKMLWDSADLADQTRLGCKN